MSDYFYSLQMLATPAWVYDWPEQAQNAFLDHWNLSNLSNEENQ